MNKLLATSG